MTDIKRDLEELGRELWPRSDALRPSLTVRAGSDTQSGKRGRGLEPLATVALAAALIALFAAAFVLGRSQTPRTATPTPPRPTVPVASATAAQLAIGQWSSLPPAPIPPRDQASVIWTGAELLVWGGVSDANGGVLHADGAAYDPTTGLWRILARAPLSPRVGQVAVWDGAEMMIWGGSSNDSSGQPTVQSDGAAYDPATDSWRTLPPAPLSPGTQVIAAWTGTTMILLGERAATSNGGIGGAFDGAAYDPSTDQWSSIGVPPAPSGHPFRWSTAVQAGSELLAWSEWAMSTPCGSGCTSTNFGTDLFAYNQHTRAWHLVAPTSGAQHDAAHAVWTGRVVLVQSSGWCGGCVGPSQLSSAAQYDPATNRWTPLLTGPLASAQPTYAWTGDALFAFNPGTTGGGSLTLRPGDASAYDPATGWVQLPSAPFGCGVSSLPIWTGRQVLMYCPRTATVPASNHDGIALTAGP